jgi:hypothetical protein
MRSERRNPADLKQRGGGPAATVIIGVHGS